MKKLLAIFLTLLLLTGCTVAPAAPTAATLPAEETAIPETTAPAETEVPLETICKDGVLIVHFIDVGQADCALLECGGMSMLIDGGNTEDGWDVVEYIENQGIEKLDLVVGTHPHEDHIGGLPAVMDAFPVDTVWSGIIPYNNGTTYAFKDTAFDKNLIIAYPGLGDTYTLGDAQVTVLGPVRSYYEDVNDLSLVLMVEYGDTRFLFTGDMEMLAEDDMLDHWGENYDFTADVLKVGHHGSYSSTGYRLLREVAPTWAVIPCGYQNEYGHPHENTLSRLRDAEVITFRMDLMSTVIALSDGETIAFSWMNSGYEPAIPN